MTKAALRRLVFADPRRVTPELVDEVYQETRGPGSGLAFQAFQRSEVRWRDMRSSYRNRLGELRCPVLLVNGAGDKLVPVRFVEAAHQQIPRSKLVVIPNCGHWPMRECPDDFRDAVIRFLQEER
jgi:pimeloyl-ACP methyl ester carboxylesterase